MMSLHTSINDAPRTLRSVEAIAERREMLAAPHIASLVRYVKELREKYPAWEFQDFDPFDGGVEADLLFLQEKPGPMTSPTGTKRGSGFISRNNDDPTAEAVFDFMIKAGIPRKRTVLWNVIPWWDGSIKVKAKDVRDGIEELKVLLPLLPKLKAVVLVGRRAQRAHTLFHEMNLQVFRSAHPSRKVKLRYPDQWNAIPDRWKEAAQV
jgi:hypothetical protein